MFQNIPEPTFPVQTWMFETEKKGLIAKGVLIGNLGSYLKICLSVLSEASEFASPGYLIFSP